jgi:putative hemolysin
MIAALLRQTLMPLPPVLVRPRQLLRAGRPDINTFARKIEVDFSVRDYQVKTIATPAELKRILGLRREVFHYEFARKWLSLKSDFDAFDLAGDHLAIFDRKAGKVAGVYRLIPSTFSRRFYSSTEFDVDQLLHSPGTKLELSRACISREYRNGIVIGLLWKGVAEYAKAARADYLFGLSSITTMDVSRLATIHRSFEERGLTSEQFRITPRAPYAIEGFGQVLARTPATTDPAAVDALVPSLLKTYIKAGAKVCSQPVIDRDFNCADWLTVLDMRGLTASFDRRFMRS